jgi:hypothetical protein
MEHKLQWLLEKENGRKNFEAFTFENVYSVYLYMV